jgi:BR serine/threonine kinase
VIRGDQYDGRKADVWSCGVILYALLVGALPFDDDNLRVLLEKVKRGHFVIPPYLPQGAQQLLRGMVEINPVKRMALDDVMRHPWFKGSHDSSELEPVAPMSDAVETVPIETRSDIDADVFKSMASLGCFKDRTALAKALLCPEHNEEKVIYFLLLGRKERQPSTEDDTQAISSHRHNDPPRKRVDSATAPSTSSLYLNTRGRSHSIGSAGLDSTSSTRQTRVNSVATPTYNPSAAGYYTYSSPSSRTRKTSYALGDTASLTLPLGASPQQPGSPWKRKLSQTMKTFMGSPRFHRRHLDGHPESPTATNTPTPTSESPSPVMAKRSWFANLKAEKDRVEVVVVYRDKTFAELRAALLQSFTVVNCEHEDVGENVFKVKYAKSRRLKGKRVFKKPVKFLIKCVPTETAGETGEGEQSDGKTCIVSFVQTGGPSRRFYRVCDKLQSAIVNPSAINPLNTEFVDYDNPSLSSDDTLAQHTSGSPNGERSESSEVVTPETNGAGDLTEDSTSDMSDTESVPGTE